MTVNKERSSRCKRVWFSEMLLGKNTSHKIAYIAVLTAVIVAANTFEIKFAETQFSFTMAVSVLSGLLLGPLFGFVACFLGDLVGFLYNSGGFAYLPWIGISLGIAAFISGLVFNLFPTKKRWVLYVKLGIISLLSFAVCTVAINTTAFWALYSKTDYLTYLISRLIVQGQIWCSLINYALLFIIVPTLREIKPLKIGIS